MQLKFPKREKTLFATGLVVMTGILTLRISNAIAGGANQPNIPCAPITTLPEGKLNVEAINSAQEGYLLEQNTFANDLKNLALDIESQTQNYQYSTRATPTAAFNYGVSRQDDLISYVGAVFAIPNRNTKVKGAAQEMTTVTILCAAESPGKTKPADPTYQNGEVACGANTTEAYRYSP